MKFVALLLTVLAVVFFACNRPEAAPTGPKAQPVPLENAPPIGETLTLSDAEWKKKLSAEAFRVLREQGTERAGTGSLLKEKRDGTFVCGGCGAPLFHSSTKFESGTGWPSFTQPIEEGRVKSIVDKSHGMVRTEVVCARCGGHLGHVFDDGPKPTGLRYCINSVSLDFTPQAPASAP